MIDFKLCKDSYALLSTEPVMQADHLITDPPYTEHVQNNMYSGGMSWSIAYEVEAGFDPLADYQWIAPAQRFAKRWSIFFCALEQMGYYKDAMLGTWVRSGIYVKIRAQPQLSGDRPGNRCEGMSIGHAGDSRKRWNGKGSHAFWETPDDAFLIDCMPQNRKDTRHPTAKPLMLCMRLIELFTDPGETVFDPFCGTGNIGIACMLLGRDYLGLDNDPTHVKNAHERAREAWLAREKILDKFKSWKEKRAA